ncbi:MAG: hypothetical protein Q9227_001082 [Pyrenula ochraceoflavens]
MFYIIFKTTRTENNLRAVEQVESILTRLVEMTPTDERDSSNYRFYCDDDPQSLDGTSRWTLRPDPAFPPTGYRPQRERPRVPIPPPPGFSPMPHQEWQDVDNGVVMGTSTGCQNPNALGVTFRLRAWEGGPPFPGSLNRGTVTVSEFGLDL